MEPLPVPRVRLGLADKGHSSTGSTHQEIQRNPLLGRVIVWSGRRDLNLRPSPWQGTKTYFADVRKRPETASGLLL